MQTNNHLFFYETGKPYVDNYSPRGVCIQKITVAILSNNINASLQSGYRYLLIGD